MSTKRIAPMNGRFTFVVSQLSDFAMEQAAIGALATGGVCWPMEWFSVTTRPKCTASMPTAECGEVQQQQDRLFVRCQAGDGARQALRKLRLRQERPITADNATGSVTTV
jgi:hypothetical protein